MQRAYRKAQRFQGIYCVKVYKVSLDSTNILDTYWVTSVYVSVCVSPNSFDRITNTPTLLIRDNHICHDHAHWLNIVESQADSVVPQMFASAVRNRIKYFRQHFHECKVIVTCALAQIYMRLHRIFYASLGATMATNE